MNNQYSTTIQHSYVEWIDKKSLTCIFMAKIHRGSIFTLHFTGINIESKNGVNFQLMNSSAVNDGNTWLASNARACKHNQTDCNLSFLPSASFFIEVQSVMKAGIKANALILLFGP